MGNTIDDTLCNIRQGQRNGGLEPAHVPWGTVLNKGVKFTLCEGDRRRRTSGQGSDEEKQEGSMRYFVCNSPGDIWNQKRDKRAKVRGKRIPRTKSTFAPRHFLGR
jgi:hypothetical protein